MIPIKSAIIVMLALPQMVWANSTTNSTAISGVLVADVATAPSTTASKTVGFINLPQAIAGGPACGTQTTRYSINLATEGGRAMYATAMMAYSLGKQVYVYGTGNCAVWPDTETAQYLMTR